MSLESGDYLDDLVTGNPAPTDLVNQGDDHLKLIKKVLKQTFPGSGGQGYRKPITATEDELNRVSGVTAPIQEQFDALPLAYVQTDGGNQQILGVLTVNEGIDILADTSNAWNGIKIFYQGRDRGSFFFEEATGNVGIGQLDSGGALRTSFHLLNGKAYLNGAEMVSLAANQVGATGTFEDNAGKTITVTDGLITGIA